MIYMIYLDVELDWCDSIHFHELKWSTMLTSEIDYSNLCKLVSAHKKFEVWNQVAPQLKFQCGPLDLSSSVDPT